MRERKLLVKKVAISLTVLIVLSLALNVFFFVIKQSEVKYAVFKDANSRDTYFSIHNVGEAQTLSTGKGIKVGVLDHYFGFRKHRDLYAEGVDFLDEESAFNEIAEHGYWLSTTLREIAPDVEIYALNAACNNEKQRVGAMVEAIDWAISNNLDVLTYSYDPISGENVKELDAAVERAVEHGIVTTFIHYPHPKNLFPFGMYTPSKPYVRAPDVNILHYDYNTLLFNDYIRNLESPQRYGPFLSISSTSVVTAGFVALLKEISGDLKPEDYRNILIETSRELQYEDRTSGRTSDCPRVVDITAGVRRLLGSAGEKAEPTS